jgi:predicted metalloprotease with PDZ domain
MTDQQVINDLKDLVDATTRVFGKAPYKDYTFLVKVQPVVAEPSAHVNSSHIDVNEDDFVNEGNYRRFLNTAARQLVHVWIGKHIRPQQMAPLDYSREQYTRLLWFFEGAALYYADLLQVRAELTTPPELLGKWSLQIDALQHQTGRRLMNLEEASWNAWLRSDNDANNSVSYALKGEIAALLLDLEIRSRSKNTKSLDDVVRALMSNYGAAGTGVPEDGILRAVDMVAGAGFGDFYDAVVRGKQELDYNRYLSAAGLRVDVSQQPASLYFGMEYERADNNQVRLRRIMPNSPAERASLDSGDIILAMDSERVTYDNLTSQIRSKRIGKPVVLTVQRRSRVLTLNLTPAEHQDEQWNINEMPKVSLEQEQLRKDWIGMLKLEADGFEFGPHVLHRHFVQGLDRDVGIFLPKLDEDDTAAGLERVLDMLHHNDRFRELVIHVYHQHQIQRPAR